MRRALVLVLVAATCSAGCMGDDEEETGASSGAQLTLDQRVSGEADAPGSKADPVETPRSASGPDQFLSTMGEMFIDASEAEKQEFTEGFVSAVERARYFPDGPEGEHSPELPHLFTFVAQFETEDAAQSAAEFLNEDGGRPCPETCATKVDSFEVDGVPEAMGLHRFATQEAVDEVGTDEHPYDEYAITFASGTFAYSLRLRGEPGAASEEQAEAIAEKLYERVS